MSDFAVDVKSERTLRTFDRVLRKNEQTLLNLKSIRNYAVSQFFLRQPLNI
jgi:hypothetical protein